jgi:acetylornithine/N-succinyldiaminopimelate aminotransferase
MTAQPHGLRYGGTIASFSGGASYARHGRPEDVPEIWRIIDGYAREGILLPRSHEEITDKIGSFHVVVRDGEVVGVAALRDFGAGIGELRSLSVLPEMQGYGFGELLIRAVVAKARATGIGELYVITASPGYFARFGWAQLPMDDVPEVLDVDRAPDRPRHLWNTAMVLRLTGVPHRIDAPALESRVHLQVYARQPLTIVAGDGCWVTDDAGHRYLDMVAGIAVNVLGHASPVVAEAISRQARRLVQASNLYYTIPQLELADALVRRSPFDRAFFVNSGTEANEAALKLARRHGHPRGASGVVAVEGSFHGRTMGALAATGQAKYRDPFEPLPGGFSHVPLNDVDALQAAITPETCAVLIEPIQGESGVRPATDAFLIAARGACDAVGALLVFDEVQTGMGRTGSFFAFEQTPVVPDVVTLAKGLGGGVPIGAILARESAAAFERGDHGTTLGGNPLACAAALATLAALDEDRLIDNARTRGEELAIGLAGFVADGLATEVRGTGLMLALETAGPWAKAAMATARDHHGLLINATGDTTLRFVPPLTISASEVRQVLERLEPALREAASAWAASAASSPASGAA